MWWGGNLSAVILSNPRHYERSIVRAFSSNHEIIMRIRLAAIGFNAFKPGKQKPAQVIIPPGLSKSAADSAATANRGIDSAITRVIAGDAAKGETAPMSAPSKPAETRFSALRGLSVNQIIDAYLAWKPAK